MSRIVRKAVRAAVAGLCLVSLAASAAVVYEIARPRRAGWPRIRVGRDASRYLTADGGKLVLLGKPPPVGTPGEAGARDVLATAANCMVVWRFQVSPRGDGDIAEPVDPTGPRLWMFPGVEDAPSAQAHDTLLCLSPSSLRRPLLDALDDPDRFAVAHLVLAETFGDRDLWARSAFPDAEAARDSPTVTADFAGLRLTSRPGDRKPSGSADPAGQAVVRDFWNRRLAVLVAAVSLWWVAAAAAVPPLLWVTVHGRRAGVRRRRARRGLCRRCGYDLRASPARCPECGAVAATTTAKGAEP